MLLPTEIQNLVTKGLINQEQANELDRNEQATVMSLLKSNAISKLIDDHNNTAGTLTLDQVI